MYLSLLRNHFWTWVSFVSLIAAGCLPISTEQSTIEVTRLRTTAVPPTATLLPLPSPTTNSALLVELSQTVANLAYPHPYANGLVTYRQNEQLFRTDPTLTSEPAPSAACCHGIWSPDGSTVLWLASHPEREGSTIYIANRQGNGQTIYIEPTLLRSPAWAADSRRFAFLVQTNHPWGEPSSDSWLDYGFLEELWVAEKDDTGQIGRLEKVTDIQVPGIGCGGGGYSFSDQLLFDQIGYLGGGISLVWTPQNILIYNFECGNAPGYGHFDMNVMQALPHYPAELRSLMVDAEQKRWAAIMGPSMSNVFGTNQLVTGAVGSVEYEVISTSAPVHTIDIGTVSSRIYYTARERIGAKQLSLTESKGWSPYFNFYHTQLWVIEPEGTGEQLLWQSDDHSYSRITETTTGAILFVLIQNDDRLYEAMTNGLTEDAWPNYLPQTHIMRLSPDSDEPEVWAANADRISIWLPHRQN